MMQRVRKPDAYPSAAPPATYGNLPGYGLASDTFGK